MSARLAVKRLDAPIGVEILGGSPTLDFSADEIATLKRALAEHHVVLIRGEPRTSDQLLAFARKWGWVRSTPELQDGFERPLVSKVRHDPDGPAEIYRNNDFEWHTDGSMYIHEMGKETFLHGDIIPTVGGNTCFVSTYEIYEAMSNELKARLDGVRVVFDGTPYRGGFAQRKQLIVHPLVVTHPDSGRRGLYVQPYITAGILDLPNEEAQDLMVDIIERVLAPGRVYEHTWTVGDVLIADNIGCWHRRDNWDPAQTRELSLITTHIPCVAFAAPDDAPDIDPSDAPLLQYGLTDQSRKSRESAIAWAHRQRNRNLQRSTAASAGERMAQ